MKDKVAGIGPQEIAELAKMFMENKDEIKGLVEIVRPIITEVIELAMDTIGPEVERVMLRVAMGTVGIRKAVFDEYVRLDFTREEAMRLMLSDSSNSQKIGDTLSNSVKTVSK